MWLRRCGLLLVIAPSLAVVLSFSSSFVPDRLILDELAGAVERNEVVVFDQAGISGRELDSFSDCLALTMGLGETDGSSASVWLRSPTLGGCDRVTASVGAYASGDGLSGGDEYFRYWHGYTAISRPLVAAVGVTGQRIVLFWAFIGALALFARQLWRGHGWLAPAALLVPFLLTTDTVELARSIPHGVAALVAVLGAWWLHRLGSDDADGDGDRADLELASAAFLVGAAYVFVDFLTTPPGAWALCVGSVVLAGATHLHSSALSRRGLLVTGAWIFGWVWTWVSKWALAVVMLGYSRVSESVGGAIEGRVAGEGDDIDLAVFDALEANVRTWWAHPLTPPIVVAVVVIAAVLARRNDLAATWHTRLLIAAPAAIPLVWFELLRNHSVVNPVFVYRSLGVTAGLIAVALIVGPDSFRRRPPAAAPTEDQRPVELFDHQTSEA